jgi:hypothetical protein
LLAGSAASLVSTLVLGLCGWRENRRPAGPVNGPSQWLWGRAAAHRRRFSLAHTLLGYGIHHASSLFWARIHAALHSRPSGSLSGEMLRAACTSALACTVDYRVAPRRLQPGFEQQLSRTSLLLVYASFGIALGATQFLLSRNTHRHARRARVTG